MNTVNCYLVVDTLSVLQAHPNPSKDPNAPTTVAVSACYMVQAEAGLQWELYVQALLGRTDDAATSVTTYSFRTVSLSGNSSTGCVLYGVSAKSRSFSLIPTNKPASLLYTLNFENQVLTPLPTLEYRQNLKPPQFLSAVMADFGIVGVVEGGGKLKLTIRFYLTQTDEITGEPRLAGYYSWNTSLTQKTARDAITAP